MEVTVGPKNLELRAGRGREREALVRRAGEGESVRVCAPASRAAALLEAHVAQVHVEAVPVRLDRLVEAEAADDADPVGGLDGEEEHDEHLAEKPLPLRVRLAPARRPRGEALDPPRLQLGPVDPVRVLAGEEAVLHGELLRLGSHAEELLRGLDVEGESLLARLEGGVDVGGDVEEAVHLRRTHMLTQTCSAVDGTQCWPCDVDEGRLCEALQVT